MKRNVLKNFLILLTAAMFILAQPEDSYAKRRTSKDVRREKQKTEKQIEQTRKQIAANDRETGRQLDRLSTIKSDIALQNDTIEMIRARLDSVNSSINTMNDSLARLEARHKALKENYAQTLRTIRARRQGMSDLSFIFSSKSFGQAWRRLRYLNDVAKTSTRQARQLATAETDIKAARESLQKLREQHAEALSKQNQVRTALRTEQASADNIIKNLKKQGRSLKRELERRDKQAKSLARELDKIVEQEIREAEERRRKEAEEAERRRREAEEAARRQKEAEEAALRQKRQKEKAEKPADKPMAKADQAKPTETKKQEKPAADKKTETPPMPPTFMSEAEKDRRLTGSFASNKGRLLFPVAGRYTVVSNFGTYELPELSKVKVDNLGIDIEVPLKTNARTVFEGVVSSIFRLDGYNNVVIVRHGEYLTVYAGIDRLAVKKGDKVKAGQTVGTITGIPGDNRAKLHFEIRHEKEKLNPAEWVK